MSLIGVVIRKYFEREARKRPLSAWPDVLSESGDTVVERFQAAANTDGNRAFGRHIIGIEVWSQSRLRVFLGAELVMDEYDGYEPPTDLDMAGLRDAMSTARQGTLDLAAQLLAAGITEEERVPHNDMGDTNAGTWLAYINGHARRESGRFKE